MKNIARGLRAISSETLQELWRWTLPLLALTLFFISSFVLARHYHREGDEGAHRKFIRHTILGVCGACSLALILGGWLADLWWFNVNTISWVIIILPYPLGAIASWVYSVMEPDTLGDLTRSLNLPPIGD